MNIEHKLNQWCDQHAQMLNQIPGGVLVVNTQRCIEFCNQQLDRLLGYANGDLAGKKLWTLVDEEQVNEMSRELLEKSAVDAEPGFAIFKALAEVAEDHNKIWKIKKKQGGDIPFVVSFGQIKDNDHQLIGFMAIAVVAKELEYKAKEQEALSQEYKQALEALSISQKRYQQIFTYAPLGIFKFDVGSKIVDANQHMIDLLYSSREKLIGLNMLEDLKDKKVLAAVKSCLKSGEGSYEGLYKTLYGENRPLRGLFKAIRTTENKIIGGVAVFEDITERYEFKQALSESEKSYRGIFDNASHTIYILKKDGTFLNVNKAAENMYGYSVAEIIGKTPEFLAAPGKNDMSFIFDVLDKSWKGEPQVFEFWGKKKNGDIFPKQVSSTRSHYFGEEVLIVFAEDISGRKTTEMEIQRLANEDSLTSLPNRRLLIEHTNKLIQISKRNQTSLSMLYLDLDKFKDINDTLGHDIGDELLKSAGKRLVQTLREADTLARLGGDEFAILLPDSSDVIARNIAKRVIEALRKPFNIGAHEIYIKASIGIASYPQDGKNFKTLFRNVDIAMYQAKKNQYSMTFYEKQFGKEIYKRVNLENELSFAIDNEQLLLHFQPKISLVDGKAVSVEALVRWQHPEQGLLYPDRFIAIAERSHLINKLGYWVIKNAIATCCSWMEININLPVAVNISVRELMNQHLVSNIEKLLKEYNLPAKYLELEITETAIMQNTVMSMNTLSALTNLGVKISIDDFGTGYSSLNYLKQMPADQLKIDRSFVFGIQNENDFNSNDASIIRAIVALANSMGMGIVAEGVEIEAQEMFLKSIGVEYVQGYRYSRPVENNKLIKWFKKL
ncbi:MAG TPA: bifunctional diguanylate cyclase/phosphodiesterase [Aeromonadales bacterium]|nr:bifunctional diguanylate cyclase/phosphodiesterase [Aeromonadales bacterium]